MQCEECGKDFRPVPNVAQRFCCDRCRYRHHNRNKQNTTKFCDREQYRREVLRHEARLGGFTHIEAVANPPPQLTGPRLGFLPLVEPKKEEEAEQQKVA